MAPTLFAVLVTNALGMFSPGPDLFLLLKHASAGPERAWRAYYCVLGIVSGIAVHITLLFL